MKRLAIFALLTLLTLPVYSCGKEEPDREPAMKSGEIIEEYIDTVVTAPGKARDAGALVEEQQNRTEEILRQMEE
jgi:hypothetical protein